MNCYLHCEGPDTAKRIRTRAAGAWIVPLMIAVLATPEAAGQDDLNEPVPMWNTELPAGHELMQRVIRSIPTSTMQIQATIKWWWANLSFPRTCA